MRQNNSFIRLWQLADRKWLFVLQVIMGIGISCVSIYISNFAKNVVDTGINNFEFGTTLLQFIAVTVIGIALNYLIIVIQSSFSVGFISKLRCILVDKLMVCKYSYFEDKHSGAMFNKFTYDMNNVSDYISSGLPEFIRGIITFFCCLIYLLYLNVSMTLVVVVCIPLSVFPAGKISAPTYDIMDKFEQGMDEVGIMATDTVKGAKIEKAYNIQNARIDKFNNKMDEATSHYVKYEKLVAKTGPYIYLLKSAPIFICIIIGFYNSYMGAISNGELIAFILLLKNVSTPLSLFVIYITEFKSAKVSMDKLMEMIGFERESFGGEGTSSCNKSDVVFQLEKVSFQYGKELDTVLSGINLSIPMGKTIAFAGASGCGKSTLFKLLLGFHTPTGGNILLWGKNLSDLDIDEVRAQISYVSQSTYLFNGTVAENIGLGKENATFDEIVTAAKKAYAHEFIMGLPDGYQTILSESGDNLSGGQRQRLSIARAFLKNAPIFILDEMTSALDVESEKLIQQAIEQYKKNKTVILIAHRLSTIQNSDEIFVLQQGKIAEHGTHKQLLDRNGLYSDLACPAARL